MIHCKYDELLDPRTIQDYPRNPNKHGEDQLERLAKLYEYHGIRHPIILCADRKCIAAGHGRKLAAIRAGITEFPVVYQKFESDEALYAFVTADNAIATWAELDMSMINSKLPELGPDFNLEMLGLKGFNLDIPNFAPGNEDDQGKLDEKKPIQCPSCGEKFVAS